MPKKLIFLLFLALFIVLGGALLVAEEGLEGEMCVPMGIIELKPPESVEAKRSPVEFPHSAHFAHYDCKTCHHKWEGKAEIKNCTTSGCHNLAETPKPSGGKKVDKNLAVKYYKKAFHSQCIGCHNKIQISNKKAEKSFPLPWKKISTVIDPGPTSCIKCHPK